MKCNAKMQQRLESQARMFNSMLLYMLGELHKNEGFGKQRLQRVYDKTLLESYRDGQIEKAGLSFGTGDGYARFAMDNELTVEAFQERQQEALKAIGQEIRAEIEKTWAERRAYLESSKKGE